MAGVLLCIIYGSEYEIIKYQNLLYSVGIRVSESSHCFCLWDGDVSPVPESTDHMKLFHVIFLYAHTAFACHILGIGARAASVTS